LPGPTKSSGSPLSSGRFGVMSAGDGAVSSFPCVSPEPVLGK
jgi:hypothetical protein